MSKKRSEAIRTPNVERVGAQTLYLEGLWQLAGTVDALGAPYPEAKEETPYNALILLRKLYNLQQHLLKDRGDKRFRYVEHDPYKCPLCGKLVRDNRTYYYREMVWDGALIHQIMRHGWHPSELFTDFVVAATISIDRNNGSVRIAGRRTANQNGTHHLTIDRNQWHIMDALMLAGGKRQWLDKHNRERFSEAVGFLEPDASGSSVERIVLGRADMVDQNDTTILFPDPLKGLEEHEYYFHTHPPTPKPGARVSEGILYEMPSPDDLMHFVNNLAYGSTRGSIVLAPEGVYILTVRRNKQQKDIVTLPESAYEDYLDVVIDVQKQAIAHFGIKRVVSQQVFYEKVAQDTQWAQKVDRLLKKWGLRLHYKPRSFINGSWIIDGGALPL